VTSRIDWYRQKADEYRKKADEYSLMAHHASDNAPGSYVTGSSGRTKAQNRATERALDRTIQYSKKAVAFRKAAARMEMKAAYIELADVRVERSRLKNLQQIAEKKAIRELPDEQALFAGVYPTGVYYSDRRLDVNGDFKRLAAIRFRDLSYYFNDGVSENMRRIIQADIDRIIAMKGQEYSIDACGHTVTLGGK
jgi:hypothetical protein